MTAGTIVRPEALVAPAITPLKGTLLGLATVIDDITMQVPEVGLYESYNCVTTDRRAQWPCPVEFLAPPVQAAAATATTGGTLPADTYFFKVTALNAQGETLVSNEQFVTTTGTTSTATVNWAAVTGATGYRIYATSGATNTETLLIQVGAVTTYVWTGTPAIGVDAPPTVNSATDLLIKTFENPAWPTGDRFVVYAGAECKKFGGGGAAQLAALSAVFTARESFGVERGLIESTLQGATDLTPSGGAVDPIVGIGILEGDAATKYAGVPTIHLPRTLGALLVRDMGLVVDGEHYFTAQGSKVASGGGYVASNVSPAGVAAPDGELWIYASGEVMVQRGKLKEVDTLDRGTNDNLDLVERIYITSVDCYKSAVRVKVA